MIRLFPFKTRKPTVLEIMFGIASVFFFLGGAYWWGVLCITISHIRQWVIMRIIYQTNLTIKDMRTQYSAGTTLPTHIKDTLKLIYEWCESEELVIEHINSKTMHILCKIQALTVFSVFVGELFTSTNSLLFTPQFAILGVFFLIHERIVILNKKVTKTLK